MKKSAFITCLVLTAGLFACQKDINSINNRALYQKSGNTINLSHLDSTTRNARDLVQSVIKEMKKSPQGKAMNKGEENANGETRDDKRAEKSR